MASLHIDYGECSPGEVSDILGRALLTWGTSIPVRIHLEQRLHEVDSISDNYAAARRLLALLEIDQMLAVNPEKAIVIAMTYAAQDAQEMHKRMTAELEQCRSSSQYLEAAAILSKAMYTWPRRGSSFSHHLEQVLTGHQDEVARYIGQALDVVAMQQPGGHTSFFAFENSGMLGRTYGRILSVAQDAVASLQEQSGLKI